VRKAIDFFATVAGLDPNTSPRDALAEIAPILNELGRRSLDPRELRVAGLFGVSIRLAATFNAADMVAATPAPPPPSPTVLLADLDRFIALLAEAADRPGDAAAKAGHALRIVSGVAMLVDQLEALPSLLAAFDVGDNLPRRAAAHRPKAAPHQTRNRRKADRRVRRGSK
jgi:hypothetical protein